MSKEADPQPERRYLAACCAGFLYLLTGLLGATVVSLFAALPQALIMAIAGLALLGTLGHSLHQALQPDRIGKPPSSLFWSPRRASLALALARRSGAYWLEVWR